MSGLSHAQISPQPPQQTPQQLAKPTGDWTLFTEFDRLIYSESFSISDILALVDSDDIFGISIDGNEIDGRGFSQGGSDTFAHNQTLIGARKGAWEIALLKRRDSYANYTPDTALLILANETNIDVPNGDLDIDLRLNHSKSLGLRLGYQHQITPSLSVTGRVSGLQATQGIEGNINGDLSLLDGGIEGEILIGYDFTDDIAFEREFETSKGYGFSIDAILNWQASDKIAVEIGAYDLVNRIWFDETVRTEADATTAVVRTMENGILIVRPALTGQNFFGSFTQRLRSRVKADIQYDISDRWQLSQDLFRTRDNYLTQSEAVYSVNSDLKLGLSYEWVAKAPGVSLNWKWLNFGFSTDSLKINSARFAKLHIGLKGPL